MDAADLDLHTLRIMRAIADTGSISAAASALGYSQPAISQHLGRASDRIGLPLVARAGRGVRLTDAGAVLAKHAVTVHSALQAAHGDLADLAGVRAGAVRVAAFPTASATIVPRLLGAMAEAYPGVQLSYVEAEPPEALAQLRDGRVDLAITFRYPDDWSDPHARIADELTMSTLFDDDIMLAIPVEHPGRHERTHLNEFADDEWIAGCPLCRGNLLQACQNSGFQPRIAHETDNAAAVLGLVDNHLGVALLPRLALSSVTVPDGVHIQSVDGLTYRSVHAVTLRSAVHVPAVAAAMRVAAELETAQWQRVEPEHHPASPSAATAGASTAPPKRRSREA